jgi:uncharacterized protein
VAEAFTTICNQKQDVLMMIRWPALLLLGLLSLATPAFAGGVDCNKAADPIDKRVCADPKLLRAEEQLADIFAIRKALSPDPEAEQVGQDDWRETRDMFPTALPEYYQGRIEALQDEIAEQRKEAPVVTAEEAQKNCISFPLSLADQMLPSASRRLFKCKVDAFGEAAGSRGSIIGPLYYQLKTYDPGGGTGFAIFELATGQKNSLKLLIAVNRDEVVRYATPFVRANSGDQAWLVVPGEIKGSVSSHDGSSLYLFKNRLPHVVEGEEAVQQPKMLSPNRQ